jgi:hypothetical protein
MDGWMDGWMEGKRKMGMAACEMRWRPPLPATHAFPPIALAQQSTRPVGEPRTHDIVSAHAPTRTHEHAYTIAHAHVPCSSQKYQCGRHYLQ